MVCPKAVDKRELVMPGLAVMVGKILRPGFPDHGAGNLDVGRRRGDVLV